MLKCIIDLRGTSQSVLCAFIITSQYEFYTWPIPAYYILLYYFKPMLGTTYYKKKCSCFLPASFFASYTVYLM